MTNEDKITKLTGLWYSCLIDHHKDRDCHWHIDICWSYGEKPKYQVQHYGYLLDEISIDFDSLEKAQLFLISVLKSSIKEEAIHWINSDDEYIKEETKKGLKQVLKELEELNANS